VLDLELELDDAARGELYVAQVNCLRSLPGRGIRVWGARTLSADPAWAQIRSRRLLLTMGRWLRRSMAELAFEPNDEQLWTRVDRELRAYLAGLYERGVNGVVKNLVEARRWTARAAEAGDRSAMHNLALYYFEGHGGPQDLPAAARWFRKAAEAGIKDSQYNLGMLYQAGSGVERDLGEAYKWFTIAAQSGDASARESAIALEPKLSTTQLAAADRAARSFRPGGSVQTAQLGAQLSTAAAQKVLGRLGYFKGQPTGAASREFGLAVSAYQRDQGLPVTGAIDPTTASRLSVFTR
jgi:localization factor PodJL